MLLSKNFGFHFHFFEKVEQTVIVLSGVVVVVVVIVVVFVVINIVDIN